MTSKEHREVAQQRGRLIAVLLHDTLLEVQGQEAHHVLLPML